MEYKPLVLVVDDNETNRELIREILEDEEYRVNEAENGQKGYLKALEEIPDLILMDVEMPVMNGLEATRKIIETPETNRIPVIVLTGLNDTEDRIKAYNCGAMDFVTKPFNALELMARVKSYIRFSILNKKYVLSTISTETGLPNRAAFHEKLPDTSNPKLLLLKIDDIESISRFYGEATGTAIEKEFAAFLLTAQTNEIKVQSTLFHLGKGLFGFLLEDSEDIISRTTAREIILELGKRFDSIRPQIKDEHYEIEFTAVAGFTKENMLEKSELALDEALRNKTSILVMDDIIQDVYQNIGDNIFWLKKIKDAVQNDRLVPFYQPIFNSNTGKIEKFESLVRMIDENGSIISPGQFLLIAKNSKYYPDITRLMTRQSINDFKNRPEEFSLNLSALDIENKNVRDFFLENLLKFPGIASRLTLEIVEQEGVKYIDTLRDFVRQVKQFGVKIAIDDFGSGYSNFKMLLDMEIDYLKIDGSLIRNIHKDASNRNVVETIKTFADKTNIGIIAEFVENEDIFNCLKQMGIHYFQGYYIGKPQKL